MRKHTYLVILIVLSLLPLFSLYSTTSLLHTHDGLVHLPRTAAYFKALADGQFPVRWAADLNYGYGMPLFNFMYQIPYLLASLLLVLQVGLVNAFKVTLGLSYILSGVFMYLFAKEFFEDKTKGFVVAVFYQFATFRFIELLLRGSFGEVYTYTFLPLVLLGLARLLKKQDLSRFTLTAVATALLILSHNSISLVFFGIAALFLLCFSQKRKQLFYGGAALITGLLLAAFYWMPAILEHKFTFGNLFMKDLFRNHFAPLYMFFAPNIFNQRMFQIEQISVQIGLFHVVAIVIAAYAIWRNKKRSWFEKRLLLFTSILLFGALFLMQPISKPIWESVALLRQFQFPWRFVSVTVLATSLLSVYFLNIKIIKKYLPIFLGIVVISTVLYWQPQLGYDKIDEKLYWNFPLTTTYYGETDVIWSAGPAKAYPKQRVEIVSGQGEIKDFQKRSTSQTFIIDAAKDTNVVSHTQFFPGWKAFVDDREVPIQFQDPNHRGELLFSVPQGKHTVTLTFTETKIRLFADVLSLVTAVGLGGMLLFQKVRKYAL